MIGRLRLIIKYHAQLKSAIERRKPTPLGMHYSNLKISLKKLSIARSDFLQTKGL